MVLFTAACNAILGIGDLVEPTSDARPDASSGDASEPPPLTEGGADAGDTGADATRDIPPCTENLTDDPCVFTEPQEAGAIFPTWVITSSLPIRAQNVAVIQPVRPVYEVDGGEVLEVRSGLRWRVLDAGAPYADASAGCEALGAGWHVPELIELVTTQHRETEPTDGYLTKCTPNELSPSPFAFTWSATLVPGSTPAQRYTELETACGVSSSVEPNALVGVRCVHGEHRPAHFIVSVSKNSVHAVETGLEWERSGVIVQTYSEAKAHCDGLGWRVPIIQELYSIIDRRTTKLFHPLLFPSPLDAGPSPRAILSQTIYTKSSGNPFYEMVALLDGPWGVEDQMPEDDTQRDILVRCVHPAP